MKDLHIPMHLSDTTKNIVIETLEKVTSGYKEGKSKEWFIEQWKIIKSKIEADFEWKISNMMDWMEKNNDPFSHIKKWDQSEALAKELEVFWEYRLKDGAVECTKLKNSEGLDAIIEMEVLNIRKFLQASPYRKEFEVDEKIMPITELKINKDWIFLLNQEEEKDYLINKIWVWDRIFLHNVRNYAVEMGDVDRMEWLFNHPVLKEREKKWLENMEQFPSLMENQAQWYSLNLNEKKEEDVAGFLFCTACERGCLEMVKWFFKSPCLDFRRQKDEHLNLCKTTYQGYKPIRVAAKNHHWDVVKWLLSSPESQKAATEKPFVLGINVHAYYDGLLVSVAKDHSDEGLEMLKFFWENEAWNEWKKSHPDQHIELNQLDERFWKELSHQAMKWLWRSPSVQRPEGDSLNSLDKMRLDNDILNQEVEHWITSLEESILMKELEEKNVNSKEEVELQAHPKKRL